MFSVRRQASLGRSEDDPRAPDQLEDFGIDPQIVLMKHDGDLVGVAIFGLEYVDAPVVTVFALGVKLTRQREGIGTILKMAAMGVVARRLDWPSAVGSQVHRNNYKMIGLNDGLGIGKNVDPIDGEYWLTAASVEAPPPPEE
jgi:Acetyltransferase (GNAT) family